MSMPHERASFRLFTLLEEEIPTLRSAGLLGDEGHRSLANAFVGISMLGFAQRVAEGEVLGKARTQELLDLLRETREELGA